MPVKRLVGLMLLLVALVALFPGCDSEMNIPLAGLGLGKQAPSFTLPNYLSGQSVYFPSDFKGRKVLLFFLSFG